MADLEFWAQIMAQPGGYGRLQELVDDDERMKRQLTDAMGYLRCSDEIAGDLVNVWTNQRFVVDADGGAARGDLSACARRPSSSLASPTGTLVRRWRPAAHSSSLSSDTALFYGFQRHAGRAASLSWQSAQRLSSCVLRCRTRLCGAG